MQIALDVFINGLAGVFTGMGVLYAAIRINAMLAGREPASRDD